MADSISSTKPPKSTSEQNKEDPTKFYHHFLYKAAIVLIFFVILPLFPSQAPEFINQSLFARNWEFLHLLFVGIAISYGLFSRRNNETEKENNSKFDSAQSLVSKFLQVSSFFEDDAESENPSESDETTKIYTWSNQHHRNEPVVVVAKQRNEKPLLLPVRSLKSRLVDDPEAAESCTEPFSVSRSNSRTGSKRFSSNLNRARNAEVEGPGSTKVEDKVKEKENVVLPSPIPWRSRSGKMEPKQEVFDAPAPSSAFAELASKPSMEESEINKVESRSVKSQTQNSRSFRASSVSPSTKFTPMASSSSESLAKNTEDLLRKKGFYKSCPPPPPPPPPMVFQKSVSLKPRNGNSFNEEASSIDKELKRSFTSERNRMNQSRVESGIQVKPIGYVKKEGMNAKLKASQEEEGDEEDEEEEDSKQESTRKNMGFRNDKFMGHSSVPLVSEPASMEFAEEGINESFLGKLIEEYDDEDTESEEEEEVNGEGRLIIQKESGEESSQTEGASFGTIVGDEGPDVDKKADEFIAKFREQIRLQRIESIKRSTRVARNSSR